MTGKPAYAEEDILVRRNLSVAFVIAVCALVVWLWWPLASELARTGLPADAEDHRVSQHVWLTGFIVISAVFISLGIRSSGDRGDER